MKYETKGKIILSSIVSLLLIYSLGEEFAYRNLNGYKIGEEIQSLKKNTQNSLNIAKLDSLEQKVKEITKEARLSWLYYLKEKVYKNN